MHTRVLHVYVPFIVCMRENALPYHQMDVGTGFLSTESVLACL